MIRKMNEWIDVQYEDVVDIPSVKKRGLTIRFMTSPLDVPDMWRCQVVDDRMIFEFKYLSSVESSRSVSSDGIDFEVSKNSRRVYKIAVPLPQADGHELEIKVEMAIERMEALEHAGEIKPTNADVIQNMLHRYQAEQRLQHC